ncbi:MULTISPECIES: ead/Ea22-like family protein [Klebsiella]|uniref:ead/Ea22-like family protein n=1 Tax=Klebsiella TaxID=570 RepID=UPI001BD5E7DC|nr:MULTISPECIES: ead/Ea22-like family protein [Klebsiella]ELI8803233.1 ead/Ea22-like family protein [Klebsiella michiganensis]MDG9899407.1 ead/Ea22-like family protein [Klebsiella grimontii]MDM4528666.1 ead/Ea22-like family protein [Klebsiella michiganensis]MDM4539620.1 ead/Ea22-like family protein [Klebsiella michiganensis]
MTENTEITAEKLEEIRQRYRPTEVPKCHICGAEMTVQRMSASRITYGCAGAIYDGTGCHYAEGRSLADDHYAESRITVVDVSDPDVLAMVEALEKAQQRIAQLESRTVTVKLPDYADNGVGETWDDGFNSGIDSTCDAFRSALTAAGIKWEAE